MHLSLTDNASTEVYNEIKVAVREAGACGARVLLGDREYEVRSHPYTVVVSVFFFCNEPAAIMKRCLSTKLP